MIFLFLILPILIVLPLSFNVEPYFSFTPGMLALDSEAFSLRWYKDIFRNGMAAPDAPLNLAWFADTWNNAQWMRAIRTASSSASAPPCCRRRLARLPAIGLSRSEMPYRRLIMSILISPMIVPLVITAAGMFFFYSKIQLSQTYIGVIMAHAVLGTPFVIITVTATLVGFDKSLVGASSSLGAGPIQTFFKIQMPLIIPGVISGGLFAFHHIL